MHTYTQSKSSMAWTANTLGGIILIFFKVSSIMFLFPPLRAIFSKSAISCFIMFQLCHFLLLLFFFSFSLLLCWAFRGEGLGRVTHSFLFKCIHLSRFLKWEWFIVFPILLNIGSIQDKHRKCTYLEYFRYLGRMTFSYLSSCLCLLNQRRGDFFFAEDKVCCFYYRITTGIKISSFLQNAVLYLTLFQCWSTLSVQIGFVWTFLNPLNTLEFSMLLLISI